MEQQHTTDFITGQNGTTNDMKEAKKKVFIDIANSVKGGSGKSTFSLLLAAACSMKEGAIAYILDLDLRGTSWEPNYGYYLHSLSNVGVKNASLRALANGVTAEDQQGYEKYPFINSIMWSSKEIITAGALWSELRCNLITDPPVQSNIKIFPARAKIGNDVDKVEVDIFESAIQQVLLSTLDGLAAKDNVKEVHFILDMPPSYEKHAERIVKHLLISQDSKFYRLAYEKKDVFKFFEPYYVNLFMVCAISPAHVMQNSLYLNELLEKPNYSNSLSTLFARDRFFIRFVLNNLSDVEKIPTDTDSIHQLLKQNEPYYKRVIDWFDWPNARGSYPKPELWLIPHMILDGTTWYFTTRNTPPTVFKLDNSFSSAAQKIYNVFLKDKKKTGENKDGETK